MTTEPQLIEIQTRTDGIAILKLNNPPANTYSHLMMLQLDAAIVTLRFNKDISVVVITGEGSKFFCAGADIAMLQEAQPEFKYQFCLHANETLNRLEQTNKIVIAAINGHCVGGGLEIAMAADLRIALKGTYKLGLPEAKLGVLPGTGGTARLTRLLGKSTALHWMLTAKNVDVDTAYKAGLVQEMIEATSNEDFLQKVCSYAQQFCVPHAATLALAHIKRSVQSGGDMAFEHHLSLERELQQRLFTSSDAKEGIQSYIEKRTPHFKGQ